MAWQLTNCRYLWSTSQVITVEITANTSIDIAITKTQLTRCGCVSFSPAIEAFLAFPFPRTRWYNRTMAAPTTDHANELTMYSIVPFGVISLSSILTPELCQ